MLSRARFRELLGFEARDVALLDTQSEARDGHMLERLSLRIGGETVRGVLTRPPGDGKHPAILYGHSHGGLYHLGADELMLGREYLLEPLGPVFAQTGYVTLCIDMPAFGARATLTESAAGKALLWYGKSLIGEMVGDHQAALTYLLSRPDVDPSRVGAFGMSMGCTLSFWLCAIDERLAAVAHHCCFADLRTLIELGNRDRHGIYLTVPGMLNETDAGAVAALIAPRPQLICIGEADELTPPLAVQRAWIETKAAYDAVGAGGDIELITEPGVKHQETLRMREAMLAFFARTLKP